MRRAMPRLSLAIAAAVASCALPAAAVPSAAAVQVGWGYARPVPVPPHDTATINSLSCGGSGDCVAGGGYDELSSGASAFLVEEKNGTWGAQQPVRGLPGPATYVSAGVLTVSCAAPGNCAAGGIYQASPGVDQAFVVDEVNGTWGQGQEVPGTATLNAGGWAEVDQLSCASAGNCAAIGSYTDGNTRSQVFVAGETNGRWGGAQPLPGFTALNTAPAGQDRVSDFVSCGAPGDCAATGTFVTAAGFIKSYVGTERGGAWSTARSLSAQLDTVSCASAGHCVAAGEYWPNAAFVTETNGTWSALRVAPGVSAMTNKGYSSVTSIACPSAGNCAAVGTDFVEPAFTRQAFVVSETNGTWGKAEQIPGLAALNLQGLADGLAVSCDAPGSCSAGGDYTRVYYSQGFIAREQNGHWGNAQPVAGLAALSANGDAKVTAVSCGASRSCAAAGYYGPSPSERNPFVVSQVPLKPTATVLVTSAQNAVYGDEQVIRAAVAVSAPSGTAGGTVTVRAASTVTCTVTLRGGTGSCALPATRLNAGTARLTATYNGGTGLASSTSAAVVLSVRKAATRTTLKLSAGTVTYGHEQAEKLSVTVSPRFRGIPGGRVAAKAGRVTVCVITLRRGTGSCTLGARALPPGGYRLTAVYGGGTDFTGSGSAATTLTIH